MPRFAHIASTNLVPVCGLTALLSLAAGASAQVANLRITEVDPIANTVEIRNDGPAFTTSVAHPFCHRFNYASSIPSGTSFAAGQLRTFTVASLTDGDSDLWLYINGSAFGNANNMVHGLKFGPAANIGRTGIASTRVPPLWTGSARFIPSPASSQTVAWDGFGIDPRDFYIDATPTLGSVDSTTPGTVPSTITATGGVQNFENVLLGDTIEAVADWFIINGSANQGMFTARSVNDVNGSISPRGTSTRWIRVRDQDPSDVQNRFYGGEINAASPFQAYTWSFFINIEEVPPAAGGPRLLIQHNNGGGTFVNTWGVELSAAGASLVGPGIGPPLALFPLSGSTGLFNWVQVSFTVNFDTSAISASVNGVEVVTNQPIVPPDVSPTDFRVCYRGEGVGNIASFLLDDLELGFSAAPPVECPGDADGNLAVNFDDITSVLGNFGASYQPNSGPGDANNDGLVTFDDVTTVLGNFGSSCALAR